MANNHDGLRFGLFVAPIHDASENPTLALERDVQMIQHAEAVGFDEVWIGEHHSAGWEFIGSPEVFIAHVAARTSRIMLGTGMVSLPYHNPLWAAERIVLLDHLTRGRVIVAVVIAVAAVAAGGTAFALTTSPPSHVVSMATAGRTSAALKITAGTPVLELSVGTLGGTLLRVSTPDDAPGRPVLSGPA